MVCYRSGVHNIRSADAARGQLGFEFLNPARSGSGRIWNSQIQYNPNQMANRPSIFQTVLYSVTHHPNLHICYNEGSVTYRWKSLTTLQQSMRQLGFHPCNTWTQLNGVHHKFSLFKRQLIKIYFLTHNQCYKVQTDYAKACDICST